MRACTVTQDPKTVIRVKSSGDTLATWEADARAAKWEAGDKSNEQEDRGAKAYVRGSQQVFRTQAALESLLGSQVMKVRGCGCAGVRALGAHARSLVLACRCVVGWVG